LIDELKARVPIWKREVYQEGDGESVWKENIEWFQGKQQRVMIKADHVNNHDGTKTSS
jgi:molybdopterin synthase catalytic subunit